MTLRTSEKPKQISHTKLVKIGRAWLFRASPIVITEIATIGEEPDVIGWRGGLSYLIECKASRSDFKADANKEFRNRADMGIGRYRYYLTPVNLVKPDELPCGWGLLETDGKRVFTRVHGTAFHTINHTQETQILISALRRVARGPNRTVSISAYTYDTGNRATLSLDISDNCDAPVEIPEVVELKGVA